MIVIAVRNRSTGKGRGDCMNYHVLDETELLDENGKLDIYAFMRSKEIRTYMRKYKTFSIPSQRILKREREHVKKRLHLEMIRNITKMREIILLRLTMRLLRIVKNELMNAKKKLKNMRT